MSKYNDLFKKIELFEKLAVYSDRSYFLQAISKKSSDSNDDKPSDQTTDLPPNKS